MRIIGGTVGGRTLKSRKGRETRPTADRVRQAIFNILGPDAPDRVLDLYAGTGALGLEALSRGAREAVFVDSDAEACALIAENAQALGFTVTVDKSFVMKWKPRGKFGWIFLDPPYASRELGRAIERAEPLLEEDGVVIAEHDAKSAPAERYGGLARTDVRRYGQTGVSFYRRSHE